MSTSAARTVGGKACGPRALDGRVGRARPDPRAGKRVTTSGQLNITNRVRRPGVDLRPRVGAWLLRVWIELEDLQWTFPLKPFM